MQIVPAISLDVDRTAKCFASAFAADPLMSYFFADHPAGRNAAAERFFSLLMRARIAMGMPALVAREGDRLLGGAMGYSTEPPDWPAAHQQEWDALEHSSAGIAGRFALYDQISEAAVPLEPHYYLGVLGVAPEARGTGAGGALLQAFCRLSAEDPRSRGIYLETANPEFKGPGSIYFSEMYRARPLNYTFSYSLTKPNCKSSLPPPSTSIAR